LLVLADEAYSISVRTGNRGQQLLGMGLRAFALHQMDQPAESAAASAKFLALARDINNLWALANGLFVTTIGLNIEERYDEAYKVATEAYGVFQQLKDRQFMAITLSGAGDFQFMLGNVAASEDAYVQVARLWDEIGNQGAIAAILARRSYVAIEQGRLADARDLLKRCLRIRQTLPDQTEMGEPLEVFARLALAEDDPARGVTLLGAAKVVRGESPLRVDRIMIARLVQRTEDALRARLAPDAFERAWAAGEAMTLDQAAAYALEEGYAGGNSSASIS
jgi:tetratricopeptide (TPR) repeat protein